MNLVMKVPFHVSSIRNCVVTVNMSDIRSRKVKNGVKDQNGCCTFGFLIWEFASKNKAAISLFLETAIILSIIR